MASPVAFDLTKNTWTKVATNVTEGQVWIVENRPVYMHYYVATGGAAPTDTTLGSPMPEPGLPISVDVASDIYIRAGGYDGRVLVSL
jgi:hypothetical protein